MANKIIFMFILIVLFVGVFTAFTTVVNAQGFDLICSKQQKMLVTLKDDVNIDSKKVEISNVPNVKIIKIQDRNEEWSRMVNKMDLPKMDNPFKNEFTIKLKRDANSDEIYKEIKEMDFVEDVQYLPKNECVWK